MSPADPIRLHQDQDLFLEAVRFTAAQTRFARRLIEKDYFCTVLLQYLAAETSLVFKGGTCLAKVHVGFFRLSEDLDFVVPIAIDAPRAERRRLAAPVKDAVEHLPDRLAGFEIVEPVAGANESRQYIGVVGYESPMMREPETIKIEVGLREPLLAPVFRGAARTLLLDPITGESRLPAIDVACISRAEAIAEKLRAALTRRAPAIRDFFDIDHLTAHQGLDPDDEDLAHLLRDKLGVPGTAPVDTSAERLADLRRQLEPQLRPVLHEEDFGAFDLERAFETVADFAERLEAGWARS